MMLVIKEHLFVEIGTIFGVEFTLTFPTISIKDRIQLFISVKPLRVEKEVASKAKACFAFF